MSTFQLIIILSVLSILILIISFLIIKPYLTKLNDIRMMNAMNDKYNLFAELSVEDINNTLDNYFSVYVRRYIVYKFVSNNILYINKDDTENMIKDITKNIAIEISELYIFYIRMVYEINTDEDLLRFINNRVKNISVEEIINYNQSKM